MKKSAVIWIIIIIVILAVIGVAVYMNGSGQSSVPAAASVPTGASDQSSGLPVSTASTTAPAGTVVLNISTSASLGTYLVASNGMTLYTYGQDTSGVSNCTGTCATAWPPYTVSSAAAASLAAGAGISGTVSTITRADGTMQVTYNGMPLYFFQSDSNPGDTTGQGVNGFTVATP